MTKPISQEWIERLVGFDTTSRLSNLALIDCIADYLGQHGIKAEKIFDASGKKANLYATIGPKDRGGIVLSGHTDVVPVDGQDWHTDPFKLVEKDGRLWGRGTSDMKSFIAICVALLPEMLKQPLRTPLHFAFSYDEEIGCLGVHGIVDFLKRGGPRPEMVIVGEPTDMQVVNAHKSVCACNTSVYGLEAHSSATHQGVNAIQYAAEMIAELNRLQRRYQQPDKTEPRFEPPHTTITVGQINGGTARNILAKECHFLWDVRSVRPEHDSEVVEAFKAFVAAEILPEMRKIYPGATVETTIAAFVPPFLPQQASKVEQLALRLAQQNNTQAVSYGTEAGVFEVANIPTVVCGPGNIREAHKPNEYIELSQVAEGEAFMRRLIDFCAGEGSLAFMKS